MVEIVRLDYTYPGASVQTLHALSFRIERGEVFGFLGPSGAGKSTTQKILIGLLQGYGGRVRVMEKEVRAWGSDYYERIGVSYEFPTHYLKLTARENLAYFRALYSGETESPETLLEWVNLGEDADKRVAEFSKGMRNRLNVARLLLNRPQLLFLDEPTSGLDPTNAYQVKELIRKKQREGVTVFLTTHDMSVADDLCDRVAFLVEGRIATIETPRNLKRAYGRRTVRVEYGDENASRQSDFDLNGLGDNPAFLDLLRNETILTIHTQETTLEQVFIEVTGKRLL